MMPKTLQTMARAYQQICAGEDPWTALGNFTNAWYDYAKDIRTALVSEPLGKPDRDTEHTRHLGAFCAASVEFLTCLAASHYLTGNRFTKSRGEPA